MARFSVLVAVLTAALFGLISACSGEDSNSNNITASGGGTASNGTSSGGSGAGFTFDAGTDDGGLNEDSACAQSSAEASLVKKPVDVIIVVDNSGSMTDEIISIEQNINQNFAQIIEMSGIDYRVIMFAQHGPANPNESICIEAPLSGIPMGDCSPPPAQPVDNPPKFFHFSRSNSSHNSWCNVLAYFDQADEFNQHPNGYQDLLRQEAFKVFIEITDDGVDCSNSALGVDFDDNDNVADGTTAADQFDTALLALSPTQFGDAMNRNYRWYSIVGLGNKDDNNPADPWLPADPETTSECNTAVAPGTGYQSLSIKTGGLRFPLCQFALYDVVFNEIAQGVIDGAQVPCEFEIPDPPPGETIDLDTVEVEYTPMGMGTPQGLTQVASAAECGPGNFYIDGNTIHLCPAICTTVQADDDAKLNILFGCEIGAN